MTFLVSYSGGLGSFMAAHLIEQSGADFELVFCDTKTEDFDLYRFLNETEKFFNKKIIRLEDGRDIWQVQADVKFQANSQKDPCSRILKRELFKKWMRANYQPSEAILVLGIDHTETHRLKDFKRNHAPFEVIAPLCKIERSREDIVDTLHMAGIEPPRLYEMGFPHNNCGGFCVKSGQKQAALLLKKLPDTYAWHEKKQEEVFVSMGAKHPTIRKNVNGKTYYLSLRDFRLFLESGGKAEMFEEGNCACF